MPVAGNAFAALVAEVSRRLQFTSGTQFLAFPEFSLRVGLADLAFEAQEVAAAAGLDAANAQREALLNQEDFAILVNLLPQADSRFISDGRLLWSVYDQVLRSAILPLEDTSGRERHLH